MNTQQRIDCERIALNISPIYIDAFAYYNDTYSRWQIKVATYVTNQTTTNANEILAAILNYAPNAPDVQLEWVSTNRHIFWE